MQERTRAAITCLKPVPDYLRRIDDPPGQLYIRTATDDAEHSNPEDAFHELMQRPRIAIVGSRKISTYGQSVTRHFAQELAARGVVIVSGLAIGVDAIAHRAALDAGGLSIAVLPGGVDTVYPRSNARLAEHILQSGGALVSEYPPAMPALIHHFVARNRIVAGLANALLITEAAEHSGTLHTAGFALEQGIDVLAVPGSISSPTSKGTNKLIKTGATPVTEVADILYVLGMADHQSVQVVRPAGSNPHEQQLLDLIEQGIHDGSSLLNASELSVEQFNHHLTMLEITAKVRALGGNQWALG